MRIELPKITAKRGGIKYGEAHVPPKPPRAPLPPAPEGAGEGNWIFGIHSDGIVYSSYSSFYSHETFSSPEEAMEFWGELEEGEKVVRCWVPKPYGWEEHS